MTLIIFIPVMGNDSQTDAVKTPMKKGSRERDREREEVRGDTKRKQAG